MAGSSRAEAPSPRPLDAGARVLVRRQSRIMATEVSVQIAAPPEQRTRAEAVAEACMAWMRAVDETLSRFTPASELSRLNAGAGEWFAASDLLYEAVETALHAARASGGLFDPTLLTRLEALGYDRDFALISRRELDEGRVSQSHAEGSQSHAEGSQNRHSDATMSSPPDAGLSSSPVPLPVRGEGEPDPQVASLAPLPSAGGRGGGDEATWGRGDEDTHIALEPADRRIRLPRGARLDLGGIAKGWAADIALERLCHDCDHVLINVGGDLRLRGGPQPGQAWTTGIYDPRAEAVGDSGRYAAVVTMSRGGLFDPTLLTRLEALGYDRDFALIAGRELDEGRVSQSHAEGSQNRHSDATMSSPPDAGLSSPPVPLSLRGEGEPDPQVASLAPLPSAGGRGGGDEATWGRGDEDTHIALDPAGRRIWLPQGARLDLGGIAKGWAADIALERLCHDCDHVLINVGGDLR
ncbi:MAG TPA: FAD:protein FMN transferase, partial [Ktedonobacterales bacterium]|nr:FAD:protein FMN transferase [Ktedonobacterales bacterium]